MTLIYHEGEPPLLRYYAGLNSCESVKFVSSRFSLPKVDPRVHFAFALHVLAGEPEEEFFAEVA